MKRKFAILAGAVAAAFAVPAFAQQVTFMTGPQGGSWIPLGGALKNMWEKAIPGLQVQTMPCAGIANVRGVDEGKADVGFGNSITSVDGVHGRAPFPKKVDKACQLANLYPQYFQVVALASSGINSIADLKGKSIAVQPKGNTAEFISQQALREALRIQITQIIYRLFRWRDGDYHFSQEEKLDYDRENVAPLSAESVLMEGARILDEWPMIERRLGSLSNVYRRSAAAAEAESGKSPLVLSGEEKAVLKLLDGNQSVQEIIESSPLSEFDTCRVLYELVGRQLSERVAAGETAAPAIRAARLRTPEAAAREGIAPVARWLLGFLLVASFLTAARNPLNGLSLVQGTHPGVKSFRHQGSQTRLEKLHYAVQVFFLQNRGYPQDLNYMVVGGLVQPHDLRDPWDREYIYRTVSWGYELQGLTAEGEPDPTLLVRSVPLR